MAKQLQLYLDAFALLGDFTPLKTDCGALCARRCCRGDAETGMLLFPGEMTTLPVQEHGGRRVAVCGGVCNRAERPLSCRLFPLFPAPDAHGRMTAVVDPRGGICPLVRNADSVRFSMRFKTRVAQVGVLLLKDADSRRFLEQIWQEIAAAAQLRSRLLNNTTDDFAKK